MTDFIIVPGIGGSGEAHWQTRWQRVNPAMRRFMPASWELPDFDDWVAALETAVSEAKTPPVLVAHSLGCLLVAHWQHISGRDVSGAFLVAVPDPAASAFPSIAHRFAGSPQQRLRFPSLVVASTNDPYGSLDSVRAKAGQWGSELHVAGPFGHINGDSGLGEWPTGMELLRAFVEQTERGGQGLLR
ncbi:alpha/beta hydrolase [Mesorhizobium sp.]|uniref:RBBP9/YdeN family alpha/beta hydrolase n=1 Tax=Mesorhizobium sp. TaxID=1871066 RepID=UPI000FE744D8|nr:alpha/beta hydrolase [Mesorhizobium sp.]RWP66243.1 MAG: serine hydrolase family protein [Mesorhizobium sp.]RWP72927.1 MAG: serine hydrolase family protein [Mesorhizobium sp.]RWQ62349.1 MAG: serine hydrolase family protein [Mesorhizobium sp.]